MQKLFGNLPQNVNKLQKRLIRIGRGFRLTTKLLDDIIYSRMNGTNMCHIFFARPKRAHFRVARIYGRRETARE